MAVPAEPNAEALANLIQDQGQGQPLVQYNKFRLKNSNLKPKHNYLKRLRAPRRPKFKLARYFVDVPSSFSRLCAVLLGVSSLARKLAIFALIIGPFVYMSIECFAKCCHLCVTLSLLSAARIFCYRVFT